MAVNLARSMLNQVVMHEFAHHFLGHGGRIAAQQLSRIDAEFEADLFAVTNGAQAGETVSALYYLFSPLADVEGRTSKSSTPQYESAACRASNVENITAQVGIVPLLLADSAAGGGTYLSRNSPASARTLGKQEFARPAPGPTPETCGRIAKVALGDARQELKQLYQRMEKDFDWLFADQMRADAAQANRLLHDLSEMANNFRYMGGIAAKSAALLLRQWGLKGRDLSPLAAEAERLIDAQVGSGELLSEDLGRLLQAQGLATLQERVDLAPAARLQRADAQLQRAVRYHPAQSEAWTNLAFIAFKRGDCAAASRFGERAAATTESKNVDDMQGFSDAMKGFVRDPDACRQQAAQFHPYPGL